MDLHKKFLKPTQFAEFEIIKAIINEDWQSGEKLPPERNLAEQLGITRPTLREVLQRLSRDGWITITHGKSTIINDYKNNGGLGILNSIATFSTLASTKTVNDWLEFRIILFPELANKAINLNSAEILNFLDNIPTMQTSKDELVVFDWKLQLLFIKLSNNSIARMLYNDLSDMYYTHCLVYFESQEAMNLSINYYKNLKQAIIDKDLNVKKIIREVMEESAKLWHKN